MRIRPLLLTLLLYLLVGCESHEFAPDRYLWKDGVLDNETVGFHGYTLDLPDSFTLIENDATGSDDLSHYFFNEGKKVAEINEGLSYHFYQYFFFEKGNQSLILDPVGIKETL